MANEIKSTYLASQNLYAVVRSGVQAWNGSLFQNRVAGNWESYGLVMTENTIVGGLSIYAVSFPAGITDAGRYEVEIRVRLGASRDVGDTLLGVVTVDWDGAKEIGPANQFAAAAIVAGKTPAQALKYIGAMAAGASEDCNTATEKFNDFAGDLAVTVPVDESGNRTGVTYH